MKLPINITVVAGISLQSSNTKVSEQSSATITAIRKAIEKTEDQLQEQLDGRLEIDIKHDVIQGYKGFHKIHIPDVVHHITVWAPTEIHWELETNIRKELK